MGNCVADGWREEDLVFLDYPATGPYEIYVDPFASCGQPAVRFTLTIYEAGPDGEPRTRPSRGAASSSRARPRGESRRTAARWRGLFIAEKQFE